MCCEFVSLIVSKTGAVFHSKKENNHEAIISEFELNDKKAFPTICRVEIKPKSYAGLTRNKKDWEFKIDEKEKPDWFDKKHEEACWTAWKKIVVEQVALGKEERKGVKDTYLLACDNSTVEALDNSTVEAWGNSTVKALDNSTVKALDNSTVEAWGNSTVEALGNSTVKALGNSTVEAWGNSTVEALDNSTVKTEGINTVAKVFSVSVKFSVKAGIAIDYTKKEIVVSKSAGFKLKAVKK